jgi:alpha-L-glutamate ligase-like protein
VKLLRALGLPFQTIRALHRAGVLGMNDRNHHYTLRWNPRSRYPLVDDKLQTKLLCERAGIPTARVLAVARFQADTRRLLEEVDAMPDFVLKPARGAMGNGILVVRRREGDRYVLAGGAVVDRAALAYHVSSTLSGMFALGGNPDVAFAEERLIVHPDLARIATDGVPDLRVVVFRGVPVMAMTRLPTRRSKGRANLHQGAVGAGVDIATGRTSHAVMEGRLMERHPDSGEPVVDLPIPDFDVALEIAVRAASETGLGYVGADVVVDARYGALILELNARPGLAIQIANHKGLLPRLKALEGRRDLADLALKERIALGQELARCA